MFTWLNKRNGPNFVQERLGRFLYNRQWKNIFLNFYIYNKEAIGSDHVLLEWNLQRVTTVREEKTIRDSHVFITKQYWSHYKDCKNIIKEICSGDRNSSTGNQLADFQTKISTTQERLRLWSNSTFDNNDREYKLLQEHLRELKKCSS